MKNRIQELRKQSLEAKPYISKERAILLTEFYKSHEAQCVSIPKQRALAFKYIMKHKKICINKGELIVGERGQEPKATPTYPEICIPTIKDLKILNSRKKVSFVVDKDLKEVYKDTIIPFWKGRSIRDRIFKEMCPEWISAYKAGVFTEFQEQRAPGHTVNGDKIYRKGFLDLKAEIRESLKKLDFFHDPEASQKKEELMAMDICADALILFANRYSKELKKIDWLLIKNKPNYVGISLNPKFKKEIIEFIEKHMPEVKKWIQ